MAVTMILGPRGDEVRVETGVGRITEVKPKGDRNVQVIIDADHLQEPVSCWVDRQGPIWPRVEKAGPVKVPGADELVPGMKVWYRVDVHRKSSVAPEKPLGELGKRDKVRDLVGLERPENAPATIDGAVAPAEPAEPAQAPPAAAAPPSRPDPAELDRDDRPDADVKLKWLEQLDAALAEGRPRADIEWLEGNALDAGATQTSIDAVKRARREHTRRTVDVELPGPNVAATALNDGTEGEGVTRSRGPGAGRDERWEIPADAPAAAVETLIARADSDSPAIAKAAEDALAKMGVARRHLAEARDPDKVGELRPAPVAAEAAPAARPAVAQVSGLSRRSAPIASDGKPWDFTNTDGRINLSSYAAGAVMEVTNLAGRLLVTRARNRAAEDPSYELKAPDETAVHGFASTLLNITDRIQHLSRDGGRVDRMASSHRLARQALREGLDLYPVPWGASPEDIDAWREAIVEHGVTLINVGLALLEGRPVSGVAAG